MYRPPQYREKRIDVMHALIAAHPFAALVTVGEHGLDANHIPFVLHPDEGPNGTLRGHVSRANPLWKTVDPKTEALVIFQGPDAYVTPSWYPSKKVDGKVVPTWVYAAVHAHGPLKVVDDPAAIRQHLDCLVGSQEQDRPAPWYASDAPDDYIANLIRGIVGIEVPISRLEGKWKLNQDKPEDNRTGTARGLRLEGGPAEQALADLVDNKGA